MQGDAPLTLIRLFVALVGASAIIAVVARRFAIPYTVALVVVGLAVGFADPLAIQVTPGLVLVVLLPGLIFEAAYHTDVAELRPSLVSVGLLAGPGVLVEALLVAVVLNAGAGLPLGEAFVVGAMVAATDPAAVIASFRRLRAPRRLAALVEAESLFNDGTGIVIFAIAVEAATTPITPGAALVSFLWTIIVSSLIGAAAGFVWSRLMVTVGDHLIELTLSLVLAYGTYLVADALHQSGVIATALAGIVLRDYGHSIGISERTREALDEVWEFVAFLATALIFLLVGVAIPLERLAAAAVPISWAIVAVLAGRAIIVYGLLGAWRWVVRRVRRQRATAGLAESPRADPTEPTPPGIREAAPAGGVPAGFAPPTPAGFAPPTPAADPILPTSWLHVIAWSGLRGAVSVALALALPNDFPDRGLLQGITFGVVLFTLLVQATTAELVLRLTGVADEGPPPDEVPVTV